MKEGPDIAQVGALIGDPARANMLSALMGGKALTASELATAAGITQQTASAHLAGALGEALLTRFIEIGWAKREMGSRVIRFTPPGEKAFLAAFP